jgi:hypothetical protein
MEVESPAEARRRRGILIGISQRPLRLRASAGEHFSDSEEPRAGLCKRRAKAQQLRTPACDVPEGQRRLAAVVVRNTFPPASSRDHGKRPGAFPMCHRFGKEVRPRQGAARAGCRRPADQVLVRPAGGPASPPRLKTGGCREKRLATALRAWLFRRGFSVCGSGPVR